MGNEVICSEKAELIKQGRTSLGIEFGSTRIKAVLVDFSGEVLGVGFHDWENSLTDGIWTYPLDEIHAGLKKCYTSLRKNVEEKYGVTLKKIGSMGISAMMHGLMAFDKEGRLLTPFKTWRNSDTEVAADELTRVFNFNIPLRWTIAHIYQAVLDKKDYVKELDFAVTLAGYIHFKLTGERVIGVGDAAGIFPVENGNYNEKMIKDFEKLALDKGYHVKLMELFPKVLSAGDNAGSLTSEGAAFLDESGNLEAGVSLCPPEGDAGTGMVATNSVAVGTGNVSAGTSIFAMLVLEKGLSKLYREIDMVTTPDGYPVAMAHANNCTSDLNAWVNIFREFAELFGIKADMGELYGKLYNASLSGDKDCDGLLSYGYYSGEGIVHLNEGRPLFARMPESKFNLANFMRSHLYASLGAVKIGLDILLKDERVKVTKIMGHGGLFKTPLVAQSYLAAAVNAPVTVMDTAGEGGPWGMAVLASYLLNKDNMSLSEYLERVIFKDAKGMTVEPDVRDAAGLEAYMERYKAGLEVEKRAVEVL